MRHWMPCLLVGMSLLALLAACNTEPQAEELTVDGRAYELEFRLPDGWQRENYNRVLTVFNGIGYASPDYEGQNYLQLTEGATFIVLGEWDAVESAEDILENHFARDISSVETIRLLGHEGTYAYGTIDQGQTIGAVYVELRIGETLRPLAFVSTVADREWANFAPTFRAIIASLRAVPSVTEEAP